jgi:hypothetical protein
MKPRLPAKNFRIRRETAGVFGEVDGGVFEPFLYQQTMSLYA